VAALSVRGQSDSPFEPPGSGVPKNTPKIEPKSSRAVPTTTISNEIEMRGYFKLGDVYYFSIHQKKIDPKSKSKRKKSEWIKNGEEAFGQFRAKHFDPSEEKLTMERQGRIEEISLHESQWGKKPGGKPPSRLPLPTARSSVRKKMPPKPKAPPPPLPPVVLNRAITPVKPVGLNSSAERQAGSSGSPSSSKSYGFVPRPVVPSLRRAPPPSPLPAFPGSGSLNDPSSGSGSAEGGVSSIGGPSAGNQPSFPALNVSNISTGGGSATGEIDLSSLPPPPPPPNILPPGPPPDIEPSVEDR